MATAMNVCALTPQEVSRYLQVGVRQVYRWIRRGELPAIRLGRSYRIEAVDLDRFLHERKTVRRSTLWQERFDRMMAASQQAFQEYLITQGHDPDGYSDEEARRLLQ